MDTLILMAICALACFGNAAIGFTLMMWLYGRFYREIQELIGHSCAAALIGMTFWPITLVAILMSAWSNRRAGATDEHADVH